MDPQAESMREFWDDRARENAAWYVDTTCDYDHPDMERFFATGPRVVEEALVCAPVQPGRRELAVEIGSGLGRVSLALADHFDRVVGVDISEEMVQRATELVAEPRVRFQVGNGVDLRPLESGCADFVTSFTVLQHLPRAELVEGYLHEGARLLRPGGVLAVQWNNLPHPTLWQARARWWRLRHRIGGPLAMDPRVAPEFIGTRIASSRIEASIERAGLQVVGSKGLGTLFAWVWASRPA